MSWPSVGLPDQFLMAEKTLHRDRSDWYSLVYRASLLNTGIPFDSFLQNLIEFVSPLFLYFHTEIVVKRYIQVIGNPMVYSTQHAFDEPSVILLK